MLAIKNIIFSIRSKHRNSSCRTQHFSDVSKICEMNVADKVSGFVDSYRAFVLRDSVLPAVIHHYLFTDTNCTRYVSNVQNALNDLLSFVSRCMFYLMVCLAVRILFVLSSTCLLKIISNDKFEFRVDTSLR